MTEQEAIGFIGECCIRILGLTILIASEVTPMRKHANREFVAKQREWLERKQDMLEVEHMVNEAMGGNV